MFVFGNPHRGNCGLIIVGWKSPSRGPDWGTSVRGRDTTDYSWGNSVESKLSAYLAAVFPRPMPRTGLRPYFARTTKRMSATDN